MVTCVTSRFGDLWISQKTFLRNSAEIAAGLHVCFEVATLRKKNCSDGATKAASKLYVLKGPGPERRVERHVPGNSIYYPHGKQNLY